MILLRFSLHSSMLFTFFVVYMTFFNNIAYSSETDAANYIKSTLTCNEKEEIELTPLAFCAFQCLKSDKLCIGIGYSDKCELCYFCQDPSTSLTFSSGVTTYSRNAATELLKGKFDFFLLNLHTWVSWLSG